MVGTWTVTCPRGGVYTGKGHYVKKGEGLQVHLRKVVTIKKPRGDSCEAEESENPRTNSFLPHGLTACEQKSLKVQRKLSSCIKATELKCCGKHTTDYSKCDCNPVAVCRATIPCD